MIAKPSAKGIGRVHATDPDEARFPAFYSGCAIAGALGLAAWALIAGTWVIALVRWLCREGP